MMSSAQMDTAHLSFHPLADVLPLIEGEAFDELAASIKANGLRDPITMFEGAILDGRNRYRACLKVGVEPRTEQFSGGDPALFVCDRNLHRRHLTDGQKAMAAAKLASFALGMNRFTSKPTGAVSISEAAKLANVCGKTIANARELYAHGTTEEIASVCNGKAAITPTADAVRARRRGTKPQKRVRAKSGEGRTGLRRKTLLKIFQRALSLLCNNCEHIEELHIPPLMESDRKKAVKQLTDALRAMRTLRDRVEHGEQDASKI